MKTENKIKRMAVGITVLFFLSLISTVYLYKESGSLSSLLTDAKLASEKLLSEKLSLDKSIAGLKKELTDSKGKNATLDKTINGMQKTLADKEARIGQLNRDKNSLISFKKENEEIQKMRAALASQVESLTDKNNQLTTQNNQLSSKLVNIESENARMLAELNTLKSLQDGPASFMVEAVKGKAQKLTVKASKTKQINVSFEVPEHIKGISSGYNIEIANERGDVINGVATVSSETIRSGAVASLNSVPSRGIQRVNVAFVPNQKLAKGIYTFNIYHNGDVVAKTKVRLSK